MTLPTVGNRLRIFERGATEGAYLQPRIMSSAVGIPAAAVLVALMIGYAVAGIVGMLVSVPTAVLFAALKRHYAGPGEQLA